MSKKYSHRKCSYKCETNSQGNFKTSICLYVLIVNCQTASPEKYISNIIQTQQVIFSNMYMYV